MQDTAPQPTPDRLPHYVSDAPFNPGRPAPMSAALQEYYTASSYTMMWWRFRRHKIAVISGVVLLAAYISILFVEMIAPYGLDQRNTSFIYAPPQGIHLFHDGSFVGPFVYPLIYRLDMETLKREYTPDRTKPQPIRMLCLGDKYDFWGLIPGSFHLLCPPRDGTMFLFGTDRLGRDMASRLVYGARISLTIGLVGITVSRR